MVSKNPTYNLKVVLQETGIKADTLRAWERRYGLPEPDRTGGGHRLYSEYDIEAIKWLLARQAEGLSISRAVTLWRSLEDEGKNPLDELAYSASAPVSGVAGGENLAELRRNWLQACQAFDEKTAERVLSQSFALHPAETVVVEVLQKGLSEIGQGWYHGVVTVQQEHFASALALRRLDAMIAAAPPPTRKGRILVACPPGEDHTFSPLLITLFLRHRGWDVVYLGANVPLTQMADTLQQVRPRLVVMTAMQLRSAAGLGEMARFLEAEKTPLAYGGLIFNRTPELRERIPGVFLGENLIGAVDKVEEILQRGNPDVSGKPASREIRAAHEYYQQRKAGIEAGVWQRLGQMGFDAQHMTTANLHLSQDIEAALALGDMDYLGPEIEWINTYLTHQNMPPQALQVYLVAYRDAVEAELNGAGKPILKWLKDLTATLAKDS